MAYNLSVWLDDKTARALEILARADDRTRGAMVRLLIRRAAKDMAGTAVSGSLPTTAEVTHPEIAKQ